MFYISESKTIRNREASENDDGIELETEQIPEADESNATQDIVDDIREVIATLNISEVQIDDIVKIIDEELKRRFGEEMDELKLFLATQRPKLSSSKLHTLHNSGDKVAESIDQFPEVQSADNNYEEQIRPHEKHTADTRLRFDERRIIDDFRIIQEEVSEGSTALPLLIESARNGKIKTDYMIQEQAEYDRLVSGITEKTPRTDYVDTKTRSSAHIKTTSTTEPKSLQIIPAIYGNPLSSSFREKTTWQPRKTTIVYRKVVSSPKTVFERQAEDFRSRLLGNNGFGDILKALKHANIGFYRRLL
ncbi:unnamed protein product [Thelazia callipaeda]|uniref:Uncharacterized protein n=1 Tax=Thelazia callipaeda TaxID=103827 RepID=A0A3P7KQR3_THECL|nr:unnamed protein product [Thelazia callipaeda]